MKFKILVKPNSKKSEIQKISEFEFKVLLKSKPKNNEANFELIDALAEYFNCSKLRLRIIAGAKTKNKIVVLV